jgi:hypothetical protein
MNIHPSSIIHHPGAFLPVATGERCHTMMMMMMMMITPQACNLQLALKPSFV